MIYTSQLDTIKRQITKNLIGLEISRHDQVVLFRPFLPQQNQKETGGMLTFAGQERF